MNKLFNRMILIAALAVTFITLTACHREREAQPAKTGYNVTVSSDPREILPNQPVKLKFQLNNSTTPLGVNDLDIVHEKLMHLLMVSDDLSYFDHIHPEPAADNYFIVETKFPHPGKYRLFLDYTPKQRDHQLGRMEITVTGTPPPRVPLIADQEFNKVVDNVRVVMKSDKPLQVGTPLTISFLVSDAVSGSPITDLEPYLGAFAHFALISEDSSQYLHAHPLEEVSSPDMRGGPLVETQTVFNKPGLYKIWAQFQRGGKIIIAPFIANIAEGRPKAPAVVADNKGGTQQIEVKVSKDGYQPSSLQLTRGIPAKITFLRVDEKNCGNEVVFNQLGVRKTLPVNQPVTIEFTPDKDGEFQFTCGMGMLRGSVVVVN